MANSKELTEQVMELHKKQTEEMKALEEQREEALKVEKYDEAAVELSQYVQQLYQGWFHRGTGMEVDGNRLRQQYEKRNFF